MLTPAQERFEWARQTIGLILIVLLIPVMANLIGFE
jgi:hypothetical protein